MESQESQLLDWSDMLIFLAVLDEKNLVGAAEKLNLSQPTVGRRLAAMESRLGVTLFARTGRKMVPTEIARQIEENARAMQREMHAVHREISGVAQGLTGQVTISAAEGTGSEWLIPVLADFQRIHPDIFVDLKIEARAADLVQREADIALRMGRPKQLDLITRKLVTIGFGIYASRKWLATQPPIKTNADLVGRSWVRGAYGGNGANLLEGFFNEIALHSSTAMSTNSPAAQIRAVEEGIGLGVLSHRWAAIRPELIRVLPDLEPATLELWLVTHEDLRHSARIRAVADHIAAAARADEDLFLTGKRSIR